MNKQHGFTLIELVMVILILGVLSVTVIPKFVDLSGSAEYAKIAASLGSMKSADTIVHSKAVVSGVKNGTITLEGTPIIIANSHPTADTILAAARVNSAEFDRTAFFVSNQLIVIWQGACIIAYLDARHISGPLFIGVLNSVNGTC